MMINSNFSRCDSDSCNDVTINNCTFQECVLTILANNEFHPTIDSVVEKQNVCWIWFSLLAFRCVVGCTMFKYIVRKFVQFRKWIVTKFRLKNRDCMPDASMLHYPEWGFSIKKDRMQNDSTWISKLEDFRYVEPWWENPASADVAWMDKSVLGFTVWEAAMKDQVLEYPTWINFKLDDFTHLEPDW